MVGLILDNIVVFLYRVIRTSIGAYRSQAWPTTTGEVEESNAPEHEMYPFAKVSYSYVANGVEHSGIYIKGFWYDSSAKHFAVQFPSRRRIMVRYNPDVPAQSFLREDDQAAISVNDLTSIF